MKEVYYENPSNNAENHPLAASIAHQSSTAPGHYHSHLSSFQIIICGFLIFLMGLYPATEMWKMVISGTILCLIPMIGEWLTIQITYLTLLAKRWILT